MKIKWTGLVVLLFAILIVPTSVVSASCNDDGFCNQTIAAGGYDHSLEYTRSMEHMASAVAEAIDDSVREYLTLFTGNSSEMNFGIYLKLHETEHESDAGNALPTRIRENNANLPSCEVNIFYSEDEAFLRFLVAHEIAHCFQFYYVPNYEPEASHNDIGWWLEGTAEYLALQVYPDFSAYLVIVQTEGFRFTYGLGFPRLIYGSVFYWQFLDQEYGRDHVINTLLNVPAYSPTNNKRVVQNYLDERFGDASEFMWRYVQALATGGIRYGLSPEQLIKVEHTILIPGTANLLQEPFSAQIHQVQNIPLEEGQKLQVTASGFHDAEQRVGLLRNNTITELYEGVPINLCDGQNLHFVTSRTDADSSETSRANLQFDVVSDDNAECSGPPPCMLGTWNYIEFPTTEDMVLSWDPVRTVARFEEDGTVSVLIERFESEHTLEDFTINTVLSGIFEGTATVNRLAERRYEVTMQPDTIMDMQVDIYIDGDHLQTVTDEDFEEYYESSSPIPQFVTCEENGTLRFERITNGVLMTWVLTPASR